MKTNEIKKLQEAYCLIGEILAYYQGVNDYAKLQRSKFELVYVNQTKPKQQD